MLVVSRDNTCTSIDLRVRHQSTFIHGGMPFINPDALVLSDIAVGLLKDCPLYDLPDIKEKTKKKKRNSEKSSLVIHYCMKQIH